jgi:hypothetical protein
MKRFALLVLLLSGCPKPAPTTNADAAAPASPSSSVVTASSGASSASPASTAPSSYAGKYAAEPATLYIPQEKDWAHTKQAKDDPSKLVGEGTLSFTIDPAGRVEGTIDSGPASPAILHGSLDGETLSATIRRKDPTDEGLYGTATAKLKGKSVEGVLKLSDARAALLREAKFTAERK